MKKLLAIAAAAGAAAFLLAGCAASGTPSAAAAPTTVTVTAKVTVTDVSRSTQTVTATRTQTVTVTPDVAVSSPGPSTPAGPSAEPYVPPEGYTVFGVASTSTTSYRFLNNDEFECAETDDSCWGLSIHTQTGCSRGGSAILTVSVKDSDAGPIGEVTGTFAESAPNEAVPVVIGQVGLRPTPETALTAQLSSVTCSS